MTPSQFLKDNFVLAVGISLPILLMLAFLAATLIPKAFVDPPRYDFLFVSNQYTNRLEPKVTVTIDVFKGSLRARLHKVEAQQMGYVPKLFRFDASSQTVREISFDIPSEIDKLESGSEIVVSEFEDIQLDTSRKAPDGYEFVDHRYGHSGPFGGLFWGGGYRRDAGIGKDGAIVRVPSPDDRYSSHNINFLGWIIP